MFDDIDLAALSETELQLLADEIDRLLALGLSATTPKAWRFRTSSPPTNGPT